MEEIGKDLAKELLATLQGAKSFAIEQAPDVVRQLLVWKYAVAVAQTVSCAMLISLILAWSIKWAPALIERQKDKYFDTDIVWMPTIIVGGTGGVILLIGVIHGAAAWLQLHFAPKVYLIEYLSRLVKS